MLRPHLSSPSVFLETASFDKENKTSFLFTDFKKILTFNHGDDIEAFFGKAESLLGKGYWLSGYFSYEFGYYLEPALYHLRQKTSFPLAWLGVCKKPLLINKGSYHPLGDDRGLSYRIKNIKPHITRRQYFSRIEKIKKYIENGLTYETNFTFKLKFDFRGDILDFYRGLRGSQPTSYTALINTGENFILSLSPELFFRREGRKIITRPMKGTCPRGFTLKEDADNRELLKASKKIKAENLMIVDLLRNDLGRVCEKVKASKLFEIEKHPTLYQMTSTVEGRLRADAGIEDIFSSLFPSGSVTGAPKIKTMEIIKELEKEPRRIYTGAIGYISPQETACFNVAIRTVSLKGCKGEMGVGGGIVYDSSEGSEYDEALLKAKFLMEGPRQFSLIETMCWEEKKGYYLLELHLERLRNSCRYFSVPLDTGKLKTGLKNLEKEMGRGRWRVRILVNQRGGISTEKEPLEKMETPVKVKISSHRVSPDDVFLYHKTTRRDLYDKERRKARKEGFFEVIFLNTNGEITEGAVTNIFVSKKGKLYTPLVKCGLLGGVLRGYLLRKGKVKEKIIYLKDVLDADKIYVGNAVRGLLEADISSLLLNK